MSGGVSQLYQPRTPGQTVQTITQVAYGFLGVLGAYKMRLLDVSCG